MAVLDNIEENVQEVIPENIDAMNRQSLKDRLLSYRRTPGSLIVIVVVVLAAVVLAVYNPVRRILMQPITATISEL